MGRIGDHTLFYGKAIATTPFAFAHYRREVIRLIAEISMGTGTLAMIGGTVVIVGFLTLAAGGTLAVQGYSSLGNIGIEALTGFLAAFINVRISAPVVAGIGLAATFGAGVTAQLGAMRINEEIDALESMAIRPIAYLVSTRIVAGLVAITPACASVDIVGALVVGAVAGVACALAVGLKYRFGFDDSLDVVGVHLVGGLVGTLLVGLLAAPTTAAIDGASGVSPGLFYGGGFDQLGRQVSGAASGAVYSAVGTTILALILKYTIGLRVDAEDEASGIDEAEHLQSGYDLVSTGSAVLAYSAEERREDEGDHRDREAVYVGGHQDWLGRGRGAGDDGQ